MLEINPASNKQVSVADYHSDAEGGGGVFYWNASVDKALHNGGTIIDPSVVFPTDWDSKSQLTTFFTAGTGAGAWVRLPLGYVSVSMFGAKSGINSYQPIKSCFDRENQTIYITGQYTIGLATDLETDNEYIPLRSNTTVYGGEDNLIISAKALTADFDKNRSSVFQIDGPETGGGSQLENIRFFNVNIKGQFADTPYTGGFEYEQYHAINIGRCAGIEVSGCKIEGFTGEGVSISPAAPVSTDVKVTNNYFRDCYRGGVTIINADGFIISNNIVEGNSWGIHVEPNLSLGQIGDNGIISNNIIRDITMPRAVLWINGTNILIDGNQIINAGTNNIDFAILTLRGKEVVFSNNVIKGCHGEDGGAYGYFVDTSFLETYMGCVIRDNYFYDCSYKRGNRFITYTDYSAGVSDVSVIEGNVFDKCYITKTTRDQHKVYYDSFIYFTGGGSADSQRVVTNNYINTSGVKYILSTTPSDLGEWKISNNTAKADTVVDLLPVASPIRIWGGETLTNNTFYGDYNNPTLVVNGSIDNYTVFKNFINGDRQVENSSKLYGAVTNANAVSGEPTLTLTDSSGAGDSGLLINSFLPGIVLKDRSGGGTNLKLSQDGLYARVGPISSSTSLTLVTSNTDQVRVGAEGDFFPMVDNSRTLGRSANRWSEVFAATGTINTSDTREKQQQRVLSDKEKSVAIELKSLIRVFKWNAAVEEKGDLARLHVGLMAQEVGNAFAEQGLDPHAYGVFCYDEWPETFEEIKSWETEYDEEGNVTTEGGSRVIQEYKPSGNRYGIRYDQLLCFVISAM
jgi:parallel beta-helix repeat protein